MKTAQRGRHPAWNTERTSMLDLIFVAVTVAFFVVSIGYVAGCERLR
jgi:hypothetical protein